MTPRARFRLYPSPPSRLYLTVNVWPTRTAMRAHWKASNILVSADCVGTSTSWTRYDAAGRITPEIGEVNLWVGRLTMEVVTHELFHATIGWGRRVRFPFARLHAEDSVNDDEERLTYVHGHLCRMFMVRAEAAGLYNHATAQAA